MSTTAEIKEALELAMARIGCPPGDNADADIYHRLSSALALIADMEGDGGRVRYGTAPGLQRNCSGCDFLSTPSESKHFRYCPGCGSVIEHPSPTAADAKNRAEELAATLGVSEGLQAKMDRVNGLIAKYAPKDSRTPVTYHDEWIRARAMEVFPPDEVNDGCPWYGHRRATEDGAARQMMRHLIKSGWIRPSPQPSVEVAEIIRAGEELIRCHRGFHEAIAQHTGKPYPWEPIESAVDQWTTATKAFSHWP